MSSMPVVTLPPPSNTTSFHLDGGSKETIVLKLGGGPTPTTSTTDDQEEIDVFDAKNYFNEGLYHQITGRPKLDPAKIRQLSSIIPDFKKDDDESLVASPPTPLPPKISTTTRSTRSESSINSRSALLLLHGKNERNTRKPTRKGFLASIGCNYCSCADKNSVDIDDCTDTTGSIKCDSVRKSTSKAIETTSNDDNDSEGSSDLFELESLSKGSNPFVSREEFESEGGYAPSEGSVEWSVVTASAAAASDSEEVVRDRKLLGQNNWKSRKEILKLRQGILLSGYCKSGKAVNVAGDAHSSSRPSSYPTTTTTTTTTTAMVGIGGGSVFDGGRKHQTVIMGGGVVMRIRDFG